MTDDKFKIFCGSANPRLAEDICRHLNVKLGEAKLGKFSDGEVYFQILENVRGADVFVVQPCSNPADFHLMELLMMIDAFKRASAWRITAVVPYYCYARQDRKDKPRVPISAKLVADLMETAGANRALTLDLHAPQIQGYFNVPVDHLYAMPVLVEYFEKKKIGNLTVVSPDAGGVERARAFAKKLHSPLAIVDIPLLYETGHAADFDRVIATVCLPANQMARLIKRGLRDTEARQRLAAQMPAIDKAARADFVIQTDGSFAETDAQVEQIWKKLNR